MANYTQHYNLKKPLQTENYDIDTANLNNDVIDEALFSKQEKVPGKGLSSNDFTNEYKTKIDTLQNIYKFKGSVNTLTELNLIEGQKIGDVYNVITENKDYAWTGSTWVILGSATNVDNLATKAEIKIQTAKVSTTEQIAQNTNYTIPINYRVGDNSLEVYYQGTKLIKNEHYIEIGTEGETSNIIQFYNWGQSVPADRLIEFRVKGVYTNE